MENKKSLSKKVLLTLIAVLMVFVCMLVIKLTSGPKSDGTIEVTVVDINGQTIDDKKIDFDEGDEIETLLKNNFENVEVKDGFLYSIDELTTPEDWSTFICLYVDGEMSSVGILEVQYKDGTVISFVDTAMSY